MLSQFNAPSILTPLMRTAISFTSFVMIDWNPTALQWPSDFERVFQPAFAQMSAIISRYQKLNIVFDSESDRSQAQRAIADAGADLLTVHQEACPHLHRTVQSGNVKNVTCVTNLA